MLNLRCLLNKVLLKRSNCYPMKKYKTPYLITTKLNSVCNLRALISLKCLGNLNFLMLARTSFNSVDNLLSEGSKSKTLLTLDLFSNLF